ncbi:MAG: sodium-dependent transporter [Bacteroidales bacterium]|nr:sodium-dependent transporter [Bacteroidales bacterium]
MKSIKEKRDGFSGMFGVLAATISSAVGLGNIWRFPYLVGQNGGAAFIIVYLLFALCLCTPMLIAEFVMGKKGQGAAYKAFINVSGKKRWGLMGIFAMVGCFIILGYYDVVGGWTIKYLIDSLMLNYRQGMEIDSAAVFADFSQSAIAPLAYCLVFMVAMAVIIIAGVRNGVEKSAKIMMPTLFVLVVLVAIRSITLPGAGEGLKYMFKPDFSLITPNVALKALGQAFLSLSIGVGMMVTYGYYTPPSKNLLQSGITTSVCDVIFAILAGCAVMPAVFAFGVNPSEGAGLIFVTLPQIFVKMPLGGLFSILFFFTVFLAALTSAVSMLEMITSSLLGMTRWSRKKATIIALSLIFMISIPCSLALGRLSGVTITGRNLFDFCDYISANVILIVCSFFTVLCVGWKIKKEEFNDLVGGSFRDKTPKWLVNVVYYTIKWAAPLVILAIVLTSILLK